MTVADGWAGGIMQKFVAIQKNMTPTETASCWDGCPGLKMSLSLSLSLSHFPLSFMSLSLSLQGMFLVKTTIAIVICMSLSLSHFPLSFLSLTLSHFPLSFLSLSLSLQGMFLLTTTNGIIPVNLYFSIFVSFLFIFHVSFSISSGPVSSKDNKSVSCH